MLVSTFDCYHEEVVFEYGALATPIVYHVKSHVISCDITCHIMWEGRRNILLHTYMCVHAYTSGHFPSQPTEKALVYTHNITV